MIHKMSNTTRLIDKLIDKSLVHREICEENRRKVEIVITEKGLDVLEKLDQQIENTEIEILKPLDIEEQRTLRSLINKMTLKN